MVRISHMRSFTFLLALSLLLTAFAASAGSAGAQGLPGTVYTQTNAPGGNEVVVFRRTLDGSLTQTGSFATGGLGTGSGLGSQGSIILSDDSRWLLTVNAGSNQISSFRVRLFGLQLADVEPSGGELPISLTSHGRLLYVLNANSSEITGFTIDNQGQLTPLAESTRSVSSAGGAQVQFSPDGSLLAVSNKPNNIIDTFVVDKNGLPGATTEQASAGQTPFGFAFDNHDHLIVSEAFGGADDAGAMSSYDVAFDGALDVISASAPTTETAACWVVITKNGKFSYTANAGSNSITGYRIENNGGLSILDANGVTATTGAGPAEMALSLNGLFLNVLNGGDGSISTYLILPQGGLIQLGTAGTLPAGSYGLASK